MDVTHLQDYNLILLSFSELRLMNFIFEARRNRMWVLCPAIFWLVNLNLIKKRLITDFTGFTKKDNSLLNHLFFKKRPLTGKLRIWHVVNKINFWVLSTSKQKCAVASLVFIITIFWATKFLSKTHFLVTFYSCLCILWFREF